MTSKRDLVVESVVGGGALVSVCLDPRRVPLRSRDRCGRDGISSVWCSPRRDKLRPSGRHWPNPSCGSRRLCRQLQLAVR